MHISYISPLSEWYLAQARPDLTAKDPTHTRLEQRKVVETSSSAWKADVLTVVRPLHENPAYKALLHHHWRAGNNSGNQRRSTNGTQPFYDRGADSGHRTHTPKHQILSLACLPFHHIRILRRRDSNSRNGWVKAICVRPLRHDASYTQLATPHCSVSRELGIM